MLKNNIHNMFMYNLKIICYKNKFFVKTIKNIIPKFNYSLEKKIENRTAHYLNLMSMSRIYHLDV